MTATRMDWQIRQGTQDEEVLREVIVGNCYSLPERFLPGDSILDVGAHIGCFAAACLGRGAGTVLCVEPSPENAALLRENLSDASGNVLIRQAALWRRGAGTVGFMARRDDQTAMGFVCDQGPIEVATVSLDELLVELGSVRLAKLDCEGAEWGALYTAEELWRVDELAVELHMKMPQRGFNCTVKDITRHLRRQGFDTLVLPIGTGEFNWVLHAWRD